MPNRLHRKDVPLEQTWDLEGLYPTVGDWEADLARLERLIAGYEQSCARTGSDADGLLDVLRLRDQILQTLERITYYADNRAVQDQTDVANQGLQQRAGRAGALVGAALSSFKPDVLALPADTLANWLRSNPELAGYRVFLEQIRSEQPHQLGSDVERAIGALSELTQSPFAIWQNTVNADVVMAPVRNEQGELVPMSFGMLGRLYQSPDRTVRKAAFDSINAGFAAHKHTLAAALATAVKRDVALAGLRRYPSALAAALTPVGLPEAALRNLVHTAEAGSVQLRRYMAFRANALGLEQLAPYDMSVPLDAEVTLSLTFAEGLDLVVAAMAPLGAEYGDLLRRAQRERWIDWADNAGKSLVPFSRGCYGYHPAVNMPWHGTLSDVITLAHELGHSVHAALSQAAQPYVYSGYSGLLAETASTVNELLLTQHLLRTSTGRRLRRYVLARAIDSFITNFFYASMATSLQMELHGMAERGLPLTYQSITEMNTELYHKFYGDTLEIAPDGIGSQWLRAPQHYFGFFFYQYLTGITAAAALSQAIVTDGRPAADRYLVFLRAGCSAPPLTVLREAGLDLEAPATGAKALAAFANLVTELEHT